MSTIYLVSIDTQVFLLIVRWTVSQAKKDDTEEEIAKYDGRWSVEHPKESSLLGDLGLVLKVL